MKSKTIATIRELLYEGELTEQEMEQLKLDERKGVQKLLQSYKRFLEKEEEKKRQWESMWTIERSLYEKGCEYIAGVDEAGRGPLAGPVVAASVILPKDFDLVGVIDSKQLSIKQREYFFEKIKQSAISYSIAVISNEQIDEQNIYEATKKAMRKAILETSIKPDFVLIDAVELEHLPFPSKSLIKGDERSISIAAASILAKVTRDELMDKIAEQFPEYQFDKHKGYGTREHLEALKRFGPTPYHRFSFAPVKKLSS